MTSCYYSSTLSVANGSKIIHIVYNNLVYVLSPQAFVTLLLQVYQLPLGLAAPPHSEKMERSTQELFLNFMIVLITVLLMWLLVKSYIE